MASSEDGATTKGCFSAILSRLLCSGSLPTHPSEHLPQLTSSTESTHQPNKAPTTESKPIDQTPFSTPGIVARLMGLDPFPDSASFSQRRTLDSILRSRSVNYVDYYLPNLDSTKQAQDKAQGQAQDKARHRRVRTSVSFREVPTFLDPQNHELLILCLDQVDEISRKSELSLKEMVRGVKRREEKEEKIKKSCKVKEEKPKKVVNGPSPKPKVGHVLGQKNEVHAKPKASLNWKSPVRPTVSRKEESVELKSMEKRENGNRSRNSSVKSPCVLHHESPMPGPISSKKSPPRFDKYVYDDRPCPNLTSRLKEDDQELKAIKLKTNKPMQTIESDYFVDMLMEVCRLAEEDTLKQSIWMAGNDELMKFEKIEEICIEFEQEALEMLLSQLVDEICSSSSQLDLGLNSVSRCRVEIFRGNAC